MDMDLSLSVGVGIAIGCTFILASPLSIWARVDITTRNKIQPAH